MNSIYRFFILEPMSISVVSVKVSGLFLKQLRNKKKVWVSKDHENEYDERREKRVRGSDKSIFQDLEEKKGYFLSCERTDFGSNDALMRETAGRLGQIKKDLSDALNPTFENGLKLGVDSAAPINSEYEVFKKKNSAFFERLIQEFELRPEGCSFSTLVLKSLLDGLSRADLASLSKTNSYLFQNFLVNRHFRVIKNNIFRRLEQAQEFRDFNEENNFAFKKAFRGSKKKESVLESLAFDFSVNLSCVPSFRSRVDPQILGSGFVESLLQKSEANAHAFFTEVCVILHRICCQLIIQFTARRFKSAGAVNDQIEAIEDQVVAVAQNVLTILLKIKKRVSEEKGVLLNQVWYIMDRLNGQLMETRPSDLAGVLEYVKSRELREYLGRKRKSKFMRPRRNDEKLKKVYKNMMRVLKEDFRRRESWGTSRGLFFKNPDPEGPLQLEAPPGPISKQRESSPSFWETPDSRFYEFYFGEVSRSRGVSLDCFFDPLKRSNTNTRFRSFTTSYLRLLLQSSPFRQDASCLLKSPQLVCRTVQRYPEELAFILKSSPHVLLSQFRKKAKFLWSVYEFYFSVEFFVNKVLE